MDDRSKYLRSLILRAMKAGKRGHWGSSASLIEIMRVLYDDIAKYDPKNPKWEGRDRIILSKGHGVLAQAVLLADKGFFPLEWLDKFCHKDGHIGGHPSPDHMPGIECHTGSLGHGLSIACGMAMAAKIRKQNYRIFVIMGDGEVNEGSVWEAAMCASKHKLDNLTVIIDYNKIQSSGFVDQVQPLEPLADKWESFGWNTLSMDGHNVKALHEALASKNENTDPWFKEISWKDDSPRCLIANTIKGKGISFAEINPAWHYKGSISDEIFKEMQDALGYVA